MAPDALPLTVVLSHLIRVRLIRRKPKRLTFGVDARRTDTPGALLQRIAAAAAAAGSAVPAGRMTLFLWGPAERNGEHTLADVGITAGSTVRVVVDWEQMDWDHDVLFHMRRAPYESSTDGDDGSDGGGGDSDESF